VQQVVGAVLLLLLHPLPGPLLLLLLLLLQGCIQSWPRGCCHLAHQNLAHQRLAHVAH
jgi:hypothetical protein